jgi:hypothetical protein
MAEDIRQHLRRDIAATHRATRSQAASEVPLEVVEQDFAALARDGYVIIAQLLSPEELAQIKAAVQPLLGPTGRNEFEGTRTQRLYGVLEKTRATDRLVAHPRILALLDRLFWPNYLLSQAQVINILPGESAQPLHPDDAFYPIPRPRVELGAATVWAIDDFTTDNGATVVVPGSQRWPDQRVPQASDARTCAAMPAGSVVFYPGTLWHGGGANRTDQARLAVTCQYCQPWLRTQENFFLSVSKATARTVSEDLQRLLGYSVHPPFMGMVHGMHPKRLLEDVEGAAGQPK